MYRMEITLISSVVIQCGGSLGLKVGEVGLELKFHWLDSLDLHENVWVG